MPIGVQPRRTGGDTQGMTVTHPLIGMSAYDAQAAWGPWHRRAAVVPAPYFELAAAAGGRPLLLPSCWSVPDGVAACADDVVAALDALVLIGGPDLDPASYGHEVHPATAETDPLRDTWERDLLRAALATDLPVLAICRGLQLLNVHQGGTLHQHLPDRLGHAGHQPAPGHFADVEVRTVPGTQLAAVLGDHALVQCSHHQVIDRVGEGLLVSARSEGEVEGAELPGHRFVVGVQWHPEESGDGRLFAALVAAARRQ